MPVPASTPAPPKHVFVTVGSTRFDALVNRVLSPPVLDALRAKGYQTLEVQCGNSDVDIGQLQKVAEDRWKLAGGVETTVWRFKPSLQADYEQADLIISHAGSGTILDVLRMKKPLIVIPNPTLLDNHQAELSDSLAGLNHLRSTTVADLPQAIEKFDISTLVPFPQFDGSRFRELLDDEMGFSHSRETSAGR
ncbi:glycosyl transferase [Epithele typhae]|uniref:glycosyl transferase n=1 Tax=Epithele typhae TaxID=378194 RepID=UPI0020080A8C|nr:glycosyl transferase [Epithele typhae]KAH9946059.1 glycosyl transferase [Epithele typhae]